MHTQHRRAHAESRSRLETGWIWTALFLIALLFVAGCEVEPDPVVEDPAVTTGEMTPVTTETSETLEAVAENPAAYVGRTLTLTGVIEEVRGPRAFVLEEEEGLVDDDRLLVVTQQPMPLLPGRAADSPWAERDLLQVTGTLRQMTVADIEREFGFDLDTEYEVEFDNQHVFVATSVTSATPTAVP